MAENQLKKTGIKKITIGDPWAPDSGNWIHVAIEQEVLCLGPQNVTTLTRVTHRFKVQSFDDILKTALDVAAQFNTLSVRKTA